MEIDEIKKLQEAIGTAEWTLRLTEFAARIGVDPEHQYAKEKFLCFRKLNSHLQAFDAETLSKILVPQPRR